MLLCISMIIFCNKLYFNLILVALSIFRVHEFSIDIITRVTKRNPRMHHYNIVYKIIGTFRREEILSLDNVINLELKGTHPTKTLGRTRSMKEPEKQR